MKSDIILFRRNEHFAFRDMRHKVLSPKSIISTYIISSYIEDFIISYLKPQKPLLKDRKKKKENI